MIKLVKERTRSLLHSLPYRLPSPLVRHAVQYSVRMVNAMAPKEGWLHGASPRELFLGRKTDLRREYCHVPVYCGARNSMQSRTLPAISLGGKGNATGSVEFFMLATKRIVLRDHWTPLPMLQDAIDYLNSLSDKKENVVNTHNTQEVKEEQVQDLFPLPTFKTVEELKESDEQEPSDDREDESVDPQPSPDHQLDVQQVIPENAATDFEFELSEAYSNVDKPRPDPEPPPIQNLEVSEKRDPRSSRNDEQEFSSPGPRQRPEYLRQTSRKNSFVFNDSFVFNLSIAEGIRKHGEVAEDSIRRS